MKIISGLNTSSEIDWDNCPGAHLVFNVGDEYTVKSVQGRFFNSVETSNWAPWSVVEVLKITAPKVGENILSFLLF